MVTRKNEDKGHDKDILDLMRQFDQYAVDTDFMPKRKRWGKNSRGRRCNATYLPNHTERRPTKIDYFFVSNRWKSSPSASKVKWGTSMHRFGTKFDHGLLSLQWAWRVRNVKAQRKPDFTQMTTAKWLQFDDFLKKKTRKM